MRRGDGRHQEPLSLITQDTTGSSIVKINYSGSNLTPSHLSEADSHFLPIQSEVLNNLDALTPLGEIAQAAAGGKLILSYDGSHHPNTKQASYSWVFSDGSTICNGLGCIQSNNNNPYRAKLYAILVSMIILQHAARSYMAQRGKVTILSDCQKALRQGLKVGPIGVKEATQDEYDIILNILQIRKEIGIEVALQWGFIANPKAPIQKNFNTSLKNIPLAASKQPTNLTFHNLYQITLTKQYFKPPTPSAQSST